MSSDGQSVDGEEHTGASKPEAQDASLPREHDEFAPDTADEAFAMAESDIRNLHLPDTVLSAILTLMRADCSPEDEQHAVDELVNMTREPAE